MLFTAIDVALASGSPTATLFHTAYTIFRGGPLVEMFAPGIAITNARRAELGLPAIERLGDIHDACACAIVALPKEFEPDVPDAANVLRIGPVLDAPPLCCEIDEVDVRAGSTPLVLVSLSTSEQGQADLLQRCVDAVAQLPVRAIVTTGPSIDPASLTAGPNTQVVRYVPHAEILPSASLVITHAGLGTTMAALGHGVPLLCTPMGRDQFFNAEQVQALGAGRMLMPDSSSDAIAQAATDILADAASRRSQAHGRCDQRLRRRGTGRRRARSARVTARSGFSPERIQPGSRFTGVSSSDGTARNAARIAAARADATTRSAALAAQIEALAEQQALTTHDDEHDPEGVTIGFERAQILGLLAGAREEIAALTARRPVSGPEPTAAA